MFDIAEVCCTVHPGTTHGKINDVLSKALKNMPSKKGGRLFRVIMLDFSIMLKTMTNWSELFV